MAALKPIASWVITLGWTLLSTGRSTEKVVVVGDIVDGRLFSVVRMGELNDSGEMTLLTSDFYTTDREVWIVSGIDQPAIEPEPTVPPWLRRWRRWLRWILRWFFA